MTLLITESRLASWPHLAWAVTPAYRNVHGEQVYRLEFPVSAPVR